MIWLALSVAVSLALALVARWGETRRQDRIAVMAWNYAIASVITGTLAWQSGVIVPTEFTWAVGTVAGLFYAIVLLLWMVAIPLTGLGVSTTAMRLAVVWPSVVAIVFYGEVPQPLQWIGIAMAISSVGLLMLASLRASVGVQRAAISGSAVGLLVVLWLSSGINATLLKVFSAAGIPHQRPVFLALIFMVAGIVCWAVVAWRRQPLTRGDLGRGLIFGALNVYSNVFLLRALEDLPAVVVVPVRDAGIIATVSLTGVLFLRERPGPWGYAAIAAATLAVVLTSL
ncbi:MAG TPA: EamA family transporter [bacterium]